jgi:hypothetical protein
MEFWALREHKVYSIIKYVLCCNGFLWISKKAGINMLQIILGIIIFFILIRIALKIVGFLIKAVLIIAAIGILIWLVTNGIDILRGAVSLF